MLSFLRATPYIRVNYFHRENRRPAAFLSGSILRSTDHGGGRSRSLQRALSFSPFVIHVYTLVDAFSDAY
ncbi:hypothetical protein WH47_12601 [Habropoda laboriosa]|uniref:Uncharacterized protein n=1 Tax=Habropoda laboriosa TaxID=597456 RepID=A0A0L7R7D8_9HYME|nr:hypothetical protein WH47_12601 [Habropoda laboriosa]